MERKVRIKIANLILLLLLIQIQATLSVSIIREKRDYQSGNNYGGAASDQAPLPGNNSNSYYPNTPLAPIPSNNQVSGQQLGNKLSSSGHLISSGAEWNQSYIDPNSGHNTSYPTLNNVQQWNRTIQTNSTHVPIRSHPPFVNRPQSGSQRPYGNQGQWNQTYPHRDQPMSGNQRPHGNQGSYGSQCNQSYPTLQPICFIGNNQLNRTAPYKDFINPWSRLFLAPSTSNNTKTRTHWSGLNYGNQNRRNIRRNHGITNTQNIYGTFDNQFNPNNTGSYESQIWNQSYPPSQELWNPSYHGPDSNLTVRQYIKKYGLKRNPNYKSTIISDSERNSEEISLCISKCTTSTDYAPLCNNDSKTYKNEKELNCARECGADIGFVYGGSC